MPIRNLKIWFLVCVTVCAAGGAGAAQPLTLDAYLPGLSVARLLPSEQRIVLERTDSGEFIVLRPGDEVPDHDGVRLLSFGRTGAMLTLPSAESADLSKGARPADRLLLVQRKTSGGFSLIVVSSQPERTSVPPPPAGGVEITVTPEGLVTGDDRADESSETPQ